jgi:mannose/fructose/N-acetylgalactosamine-specific phosphotransferase system component IIC
MHMSQPLYPPPAPPASASASREAVTALVLGILGIVCCGFVAPVAWYLGQNELRAIREGRGSAAGEGMAMAGKILGMIGTGLLILGLIVGLLWTLFFGGMAALQGLSNR